MGIRDDFSKDAQRQIAARAGYRCSKPDCRAATSGPQEDETRSVNIGVASHITAAAPNGPRYDAILTSEERKHANNGIWLCQNHGKLVDNDEVRFPVSLLKEWKNLSEAEAFDILGKPAGSEHKAFLNLICRSEVQMAQPGPGYKVHLIFGIENVGLGMARHIVLEIPRNRLFQYNPYGLDGNYRHGLNPQHALHEHNVQKYVFAGDSNIVLHPNRSLEVAKFTAKVSGVEAIQRVSIDYELHCEGYSLQSSIEIGLEEEIIRNQYRGIPVPR